MSYTPLPEKQPPYYYIILNSEYVRDYNSFHPKPVGKDIVVAVNRYAKYPPGGKRGVVVCIEGRGVLSKEEILATEDLEKGSIHFEENGQIHKIDLVQEESDWNSYVGMIDWDLEKKYDSLEEIMEARVDLFL